MERRGFIGRCLLALGAIAAAGTSALAALAPSRRIEPGPGEDGHVKYRGQFRVHPETGEVTPINAHGQAMLAEHGDGVRKFAAKAGLPKDNVNNVLCASTVNCSCGQCYCVIVYGCGGGGQGGTCNCCSDPTQGGSCCYCYPVSQWYCLVGCPVYGCICA